MPPSRSTTEAKVESTKTAIKPYSILHEANPNYQRNRGDPLLEDYVIVGESPTPTDGSPAMPRRIPRVEATSGRTKAQDAGGEQIDEEDLKGWEMVSTLDRARGVRSAVNGDSMVPSASNGQPEVKGWFGWLSGR